MILQELCYEDWDAEIPDLQRKQWSEWKSQLYDIENIQIPRCLKPKDFKEVKYSQIHVFSDASVRGYGAVAYLRICDREGKLHTAFLMGKARLAPLKTVTIPRLELTAATVAVNLG